MADLKKEQLVELAQIKLAESCGPSARLHDIAELKSQHTMLRAKLSGAPENYPSSVILKQITTTTFNTGGAAEGESQRFLNEWATLEFLTEEVREGRFGPRLLAADRANQLVILEDFGEQPSVLSILRSEDREMASHALRTLGQFLGRMHAAGHGKGEHFYAIQSKYGTTSPFSDSNLNFGERLDDLRDSVAGLQLEVPGDFYDAVTGLEQAIHDPGNPFHTFTHCDAGPHNFLYMDGEIQLLDFEFSDFEYGLCDVVSARLGFPHLATNNAVPLEVVEQLEASYQIEFSKAVPEAADNQTFQHAIVNACAHWVLSRWLGLWGHLLKERLAIGEEAALEKTGVAPGDIKAYLSGQLLLLENFVVAAQKTGHQPQIQIAAQSFHDYLRNEWPDLNPSASFQAFADD
jgi:thiamine kinase-like enzyme